MDIPRSSIRRPSNYKTTMDAGKLYPVFCDEILPGDTFVLDQSVICRLTTPIVPFMDNLYLDLQFFFVPSRLVWDHFVNFMGEQDNPDDSTEYTLPCMAVGQTAVGSLGDYFGLPTGKQFDLHDVISLPFRAYNLIWNEWYRDENLQDSVTVNKGDSADAWNTYNILPRGKKKDYFTSCLPWPQKGPTVSLPIGGTAPVVGTGKALGIMGPGTMATGAYNLCSATTTALGYAMYTGGSVGTSASHATLSADKLVGVSTDPSKSGLIADLSNASANSINAIREAFALQRLLERQARGGSRYVETLKSLFGVTSPDARLQRPELLGSYTVPIALHTVPQSSGSEESGTVKTPQGNLSAYGLGTSFKRAFAKSFVEHGYVIGLASVRGDLSYQQGLARMWSRKTWTDIYLPPLAHLGEQAVTNGEIYFQGKDVSDGSGNRVDSKAFGYQERWAEYKYATNLITGQLRSTYAQSLDVWHLAQKFDSLPTLNDTFIRENPPLARVLAVDDVPQFIFDCYNDLKCVRPMPLYCVPGMIDHF